ncbi:hypothetical protein MMG03_001238 [Fibrobacter succinogenes]|nr:hypothetical protein [Fibrobacter succinogenes]SHL34948.1 hypothetical protein SAMN05720764_11234 [Fibrobacter sp. UWH5]
MYFFKILTDLFNFSDQLFLARHVKFELTC